MSATVTLWNPAVWTAASTARSRRSRYASSASSAGTPLPPLGTATPAPRGAPRWTSFLANAHMSFTFFVLTLAFGALIGALGSLFAGLTDRYGRANLVVFGLLFTAVFVGFVLPTATNKWSFTIYGFIIAFVEGVCLVATPALIRDFSPQLGRATAMGFWTSGPLVC